MTLVLLNPHAQGGRAARMRPALHSWLQAHAPGVTLAAPNTLAESLALLRSLPSGSRVVAVGATARWTDMQGGEHHTPFLSSLTAGFDYAVGLRALNGPRWLRGCRAICGPR
jgi:diacylglycerol kinase (ATP)